MRLAAALSLRRRRAARSDKIGHDRTIRTLGYRQVTVAFLRNVAVGGAARETLGRTKRPQSVG
jgi:hypothetical protein